MIKISNISKLCDQNETKKIEETEFFNICKNVKCITESLRLMFVLDWSFKLILVLN